MWSEDARGSRSWTWGCCLRLPVSRLRRPAVQVAGLCSRALRPSVRMGGLGVGIGLRGLTRVWEATVPELSSLGGVYAMVMCWYVAVLRMMSGRACAAEGSGLTSVFACSVGECGVRGDGGADRSASGFSVGEYGVGGDGGADDSGVGGRSSRARPNIL